jgi:AraC-like DNA-binding protein
MIGRIQNLAAHSLGASRKYALASASYDTGLLLRLHEHLVYRLSIHDIAELVGFSDAANFRAESKRWTNKDSRNVPAGIPITWN